MKIETIIIAGLFMSGVFLTLDKWRFQEWYYENIYSKYPKAPNLCEHCITFWVSLFYHVFFVSQQSFLDYLYCIVAALSSTAINYMVRK